MYAAMMGISLHLCFLPGRSGLFILSENLYASLCKIAYHILPGMSFIFSDPPGYNFYEPGTGAAVESAGDYDIIGYNGPGKTQK